MKLRSYLLYGTIIVIFSSCGKYLDIDAPTTDLINSVVFNEQSTAQSAIDGLYSQALITSIFNSNSLQTFPGMLSDELKYSSSVYDEFFFNKVSTVSTDNKNFWSEPYSAIFQANRVIEGLKNSSATLGAAFCATGTAQAEFFRAYNHFLLVNFFGPVPLNLTSDIAKTRNTHRVSVDSVYNQIIADLRNAETGIVGTKNTNIRVTLPLIQSFLAKVYLYRGDNANAAAYATKVIGSGKFRLEPSLDSVFFRASKETIFKISSDSSNALVSNFAAIARFFIPTGTLAPDYQITDWLYNSFENGDLRKSRWIGTKTIDPKVYRYPFKYKQGKSNTSPSPEDFILFRLAELYLIRAEAYARLDNTVQAVKDINAIRVRAGLTALPESLSKSDVLLAIEKERRSELFTESANRWFDLKRTGRIDAVLGSVKTGWDPKAALLPVPQSEINLNSRLNPQNDGYIK